MVGYMTIFFIIQFCATIFQTFLSHKLGKKEIMPFCAGITLNWIWLIITAPLLAAPILKVFPPTILWEFMEKLI